jgi:hypothetical protein
VTDFTDDDALIADIEKHLADGDLGFADEDLLDLGSDDGALADLEAFQPDDFTARTDIEVQRHRTPPRVRRLHPRMVLHRHAQEVAADVFPLAEGERVHLVVPGTFIFGDLIEAAAVAQNWLIEELWIATLSLSQANLESLRNLQCHDYLRDLHLILSEYWYVHNRPRGGLVEYIHHLLDSPPQPPLPDPDARISVQLSVTCSHAKIVLIRTADGGHYVLHGSANLRSSASIEALCIENDPDLYAFHRGWLGRLESLYHTVNHDRPHPRNRATPGKESQWQTMTHPSRPESETTPSPKPPSTPNRRKVDAAP